ncbi:hypothetical protein LCGC14_0449110 [marine sediment metagenome]|uniref:Uncharacterized protein n=1 Tax=marine sediment metagenome TaxID=412755 RepID=A0A0F9SID6_9ZZZZ
MMVKEQLFTEIRYGGKECKCFECLCDSAAVSVGAIRLGAYWHSHKGGAEAVAKDEAPVTFNLQAARARCEAAKGIRMSGLSVEGGE